jgi:hypothetical protein
VLPDDPALDAVADAVLEIVRGATAEAVHSPADLPPEPMDDDVAKASAASMGPPGWRTRFSVTLGPRADPLVGTEHGVVREVLDALPGAALRTAAVFRAVSGAQAPISPALRRSLRDTLAAAVLTELLATRSERSVTPRLVDETLDFLIELSSSRVEAHDLTHGVIITNVLRDDPRLRFEYPADVRNAKRAPLLFDGLRSVLVVDLEGRARTELQRHRIDRLGVSGSQGSSSEEFVESGSLVAEATRRLGGMGLFLRADRTIHVFVDGHPLLVRRGEHWTAFPLELTSSIATMIGGGPAARIAVQAAFMISGQRHGAILAIVGDPSAIDAVVPTKDRYDLRDEIDREAMRTETRLHHLIDAGDLDEYTLARLAVLDGATILDTEARLLAYGAVVASADSENEGARTAAARTLSESAEVVLRVSADGDITIFRYGEAVTTLLGPEPVG